MSLRNYEGGDLVTCPMKTTRARVTIGIEVKAQNMIKVMVKATISLAVRMVRRRGTAMSAIPVTTGEIDARNQQGAYYGPPHGDYHQGGFQFNGQWGPPGPGPYFQGPPPVE